MLKASTIRHMTRLVLRMLPFIPGPELMDLFEDLRQSGTVLDKRIQEAYASLKATSQTVAELEASLQARTQRLAAVRDEYERFSKLAGVKQNEAKALIDQLELALGKNRSRDVLVAVAVNLAVGIFVFLLGVLLGPLVRSWLGIGQ